MAFTATNYLLRVSVPTSTTTATVGAFVVAASTVFEVLALNVSNTSTTNITAYCDVSVFDGTTIVPMLVKTPLYPGGSRVVAGLEKHTLPSGGAIYVTAYATNVSAIMSGVTIV